MQEMDESFLNLNLKKQQQQQKDREREIAENHMALEIISSIGS